MRVQIELSPHVKAAAEAQAAQLGYVSLAAMLRVVATGLARDYQSANPLVKFEPATSAVRSAVPQTTNLPPPEKFAKWPAHISHDLPSTDPDLYRFLISTGDIA